MEDTEPRDYDLVELEDADTFVMAEEHTAQVPNEQRVRIEREFKEGRDVNCLVATPTLELGVDIGALDMVLLRNVPPRAANYWQRAGRAGRRNRLAIIYTYARSNPHDLPFFKQAERCPGCEPWKCCVESDVWNFQQTATGQWWLKQPSYGGSKPSVLTSST